MTTHSADNQTINRQHSLIRPSLGVPCNHPMPLMIHAVCASQRWAN